MSDPNSDPVTWHTLFSGAAAAVAGLVAWVTKSHVARIDKLESKSIPSKDEFEAHERQDRETFIKLFEGQSEIKDQISQGFADMNKTINGMHVEFLHELNKKEDRHGSSYPLR